MLLKRIVDLTTAVVGLILISWLMLLIALVVRLTSKGPVLLRQKRIGRYRKEFVMYKFRTMYVHVNKYTPTHEINEPKKIITPVGLVLRKLSLDELPQLYNIVLGQMSFVGPRPCMYNEKKYIAMREKFGVNDLLPGLTGWAQVNGRDELTMKEKVQFDVDYIELQSFWFDLKVLYLTALKVITGQGVVEGGAKNAKKRRKKEVF